KAVPAMTTVGLLLLSALLVQGADEPRAVANVDADAAVRYLLGCRKANGAFGPADQPYTDAAWNYPAVKALGLLGETLVNPEAVRLHGSGRPPGHAGYGHGHFFY